MIRVFDAFSGIGGFRSALERVGGFEIVGWCEIDRFAQKAYKALYDTGGEQFYENIRDIDVGKLADFDLNSRSFSFMSSVCYPQVHSCMQTSGVFRNLRIFVQITKNSGVFTFVMTYSAVLPCGYTSCIFCEIRWRIAVNKEDGPRAIINPFKETTRQNGRRIKNPNEPMFTLTVTDRHGIVHHGRIRRLMPIEAWRLQGFTTEQFEKVAATGMSDAQLYKQAGNAVSVPVVEEIARNLLKFDEEIN